MTVRNIPSDIAFLLILIGSGVKPIPSINLLSIQSSEITGCCVLDWAIFGSSDFIRAVQVKKKSVTLIF
jgi:hypothetical protein